MKWQWIAKNAFACQISENISKFYISVAHIIFNSPPPYGKVTTLNIFQITNTRFVIFQSSPFDLDPWWVLKGDRLSIYKWITKVGVK